MPWLWILLLPFINEQRVIQAYNICKSKLSIHERKRDALSGSYIFLYKQHKIAVSLLSSECPSTTSSTTATYNTTDSSTNQHLLTSSNTPPNTDLNTSSNTTSITTSPFIYKPDIERNVDILEAINRLKKDDNPADFSGMDHDFDDTNNTTITNDNNIDKQDNAITTVIAIKSTQTIASTTTTTDNNNADNNTNTIVMHDTPTSHHLQTIPVTPPSPDWFSTLYSTHDPPCYYFNHIQGDGTCGILHIPPYTHYTPLYTTIHAPKLPPKAFLNIQNNTILCLSTIFPPESAYKSILLYGHLPVPDTLHPADVIGRRPPRCV